MFPSQLLIAEHASILVISVGATLSDKRFELDIASLRLQVTTYILVASM
jgi:hypothetical protein